MDSAPNAYPSAVKNAVDAGHKIEAIKLYREENSVGLKEAKDAIDRLARKRHVKTAGDNSDMRVPGSGGASLIRLVVSIAGFAVVYKLLST